MNIIWETITINCSNKDCKVRLTISHVFNLLHIPTKCSMKNNQQQQQGYSLHLLLVTTCNNKATVFIFSYTQPATTRLQSSSLLIHNL